MDHNENAIVKLKFQEQNGDFCFVIIKAVCVIIKTGKKLKISFRFGSIYYLMNEQLGTASVSVDNYLL